MTCKSIDKFMDMNVSYLDQGKLSRPTVTKKGMFSRHDMDCAF